MSWKPLIKTLRDSWNYNAQRFATKEEAEAMAWNIFNRWLIAIEFAAHESDDPVNCKLEGNTLISVKKETE